jgi:hypothetical protein
VVTVFLHWWMVAFLTGFGLWMLRSGACIATAGAFVRAPRGDAPFAGRLRDAVERREAIESLPGTVIARWVGGVSLAAAVLAAFTAIPATLLYAVVCVVLAATLAVIYVRLRRAGARRVASLRARSREAALPPWLAALVAVAVVSPLAYVDVSPLAALLVTVASLLIAVLGERTVHLPALLSGEDPPVDEYVDGRLRSVRAVNLFATATAPAYVFDASTWAVTFVDHPARLAPLHLAAVLLCLVALFVSTAWQTRQIRRAPPAADVERWAQRGV